ncbi:MAG: chlorophyll a/b-binding protein [Cyanobacteriota bacterium]|nr:chlorophyll a/b-binding protein [Cyanobacteriota bacterium]
MKNTKPSLTPNIERPKMGFNDYAERLNGRAAMVGFIAIIIIELITGEGVLSWLGLR